MVIVVLMTMMMVTVVMVMMVIVVGGDYDVASSTSMSSDQSIPSLNMISVRVGEFREPTPIIQQNFGFEEGD